MLRWLAPRVPPRKYRTDLQTLILDDGRSKVSFSQSETRTLGTRSGLQAKSHDVEHSPALLVYNSLPPAPVGNQLEPNSSLCPPFHIHLHEDETFNVVSGQARFLLVDQNGELHNEPQDAATSRSYSMRLDDELMGTVSCLVSRGSSITIPRGQIHTFRNASTTSRLEIEFGFSAGGVVDRSDSQGSSTKSRKSSRMSGIHLAQTDFGTKVHVDQVESSIQFGAKASPNMEKTAALHQKSGSYSDSASTERSATDTSLNFKPDVSKTFTPYEQATDMPLSKTPKTFHSGSDPLFSKVEFEDNLETCSNSLHPISTKMHRFFLNTQLYRSDCAAHSIPRALPQLLLFNHAAGVVLVPPWLLRNRFLRPFASVIGRMMNVLIGVVYGGWICGLKNTYREYSQTASLDVMVRQAENSIVDLATEVRDLETRINREREARINLKEVEESGLVCSAWKSHEFDGQDESWRKDV